LSGCGNRRTPSRHDLRDRVRVLPLAVSSSRRAGGFWRGRPAVRLAAFIGARRRASWGRRTGRDTPRRGGGLTIESVGSSPSDFAIDGAPGPPPPPASVVEGLHDPLRAQPAGPLIATGGGAVAMAAKGRSPPRSHRAPRWSSRCSSPRARTSATLRLSQPIVVGGATGEEAPASGALRRPARDRADFTPPRRVTG